MKRLKKLASELLYHATTLNNLRQIASSGVISPQAGSGVGPITTVEFTSDELQGKDVNLYDMYNNHQVSDEKMQNFNGYVFLSTDEWSAEQYASKLWESPENPAIILELSISEDRLLPDDVDSPDAKTWKDSARDIQQVKVGGNIEYSAVTHIYFTNEYGNLIDACLPNNFERKYEELLEDGEFGGSSDYDFSNFDEDDEDNDSYRGYRYDPEEEKKEEEKRKKLEQDLSKFDFDKKEGYYRVFNGPVDEVAKIFNDSQYSNTYDEETDKQVQHIEVNVDKQKEVFVNYGWYESFSPSPIIFKSNDGGQTFILDMYKSEFLSDKEVQESLKKILGNKTFTYENKSYTIDSLLESLGKKVHSRLKKNIFTK